jgi:hypothetical protein
MVKNNEDKILNSKIENKTHNSLTDIEGGDTSHRYHSDQAINKTSDVVFKSVTVDSSDLGVATADSVTSAGAVEVTTIDAGIILASADGSRWKLTISDAGAAVITEIV